VPGPNDDVVINPTAALTVTINSGSQSVKSLEGGSNAAVSLAGGLLALSAASEIDGPFGMNGGTLDLDTSLTVTATSSWTGGTISGTGTLTNNGVITLTPTTSSDAILQFQGSPVLGGTGQMLFGPEVNGNYVITYATSGSTVTNAAGHTIKSVGAGYFGAYYEGTVINQGIVEADGQGNRLDTYPGLFTNQGTLQATNGASLVLSQGSSGGPFTFDNTAGQVVVNSGTLFTNNNTVKGGSISLTNSANLQGTGTLDGVTIPQGSDLLLPGCTLTFLNTITDNGTIELQPTASAYAEVKFSGNVTLAGTGQMLFDPEVNGYYVITYATQGSTVTNAAGHTIKSVGAGYFGAYYEGTVINQGIVEADGEGGQRTPAWTRTPACSRTRACCRPSTAPVWCCPRAVRVVPSPWITPLAGSSRTEARFTSTATP
jgi:hypothetical protein